MYHRYDPEAHEWSDGPVMSTPRSRLGLATISGPTSPVTREILNMFAIGGATPNSSKTAGAGGLTATSVVEAYSSKNGGSWLTVQPLNIARHSFATMVVGDAIWVVGGLGVGDVVLDSIEV